MGIFQNLFKRRPTLGEKLEGKVNRANDLAHIINTTYDFNEFLNSFDELIDILKYLQILEGSNFFVEGSPSKDLSELNRKRPLSEKAFIDRYISIYGKENLKEQQKYLDRFSLEATKYYESILKSIVSKDIYYTPKNINLENLDTYVFEASQYIVEMNKASIGMLQRRFKIGFNRASKIMDDLEKLGIVGKEIGTKPRTVLVTKYELYKIIQNYRSQQNIANNNKQDFYTERINSYNNKFDYMNGHDFEYFCADLLKKNGFVNVEITQKSGDHGVDVLAEKDDITYAIQCKCYSDNVGNAAVQQAHTGKSLYHKDIAVVITNRYFTQQAIEEAQALGVKLWDRDKLIEMIGNE